MTALPIIANPAASSQIRAKKSACDACPRPGFALKCSAGFSHGKGLGMRLRVAGWACNPRKAGGVLGMRILAPSLPDFSLF